MRMRTTVAAVSGALVLAAAVAPAAHADSPGAGLDRPSAAERFGASADKAAQSRTGVRALPTISKVTVNAGKSIVVGTTYAKTFTVSITASHASGIEDAYVDLWHGSDPEADIDGLLMANEEAADCTASSATTSTCKLTVTAYPGTDLYANSLAGTWHVTVGALASDASVYWNDFHGTHKVQRNSKLTVNASPEPVKKGATLTVTGKLSRANWETGKYAGYTNQSVQLQFRKNGTSTYTTLKTIKSNSTGDLKTTVTASADGYYRYSFAGTTTTPAVSAAGDFVDVQ
ncbi:DUF5707 domain-containing protein [Streptomyces sp. MN13]